jgi:hypothetical protein
VGVGNAFGREVVARLMEERKSVFIVSLIEMYCCFESEVKDAVTFWARMGEIRNSHHSLVGKPPGKCPLGRPRRTLT